MCIVLNSSKFDQLSLISIVTYIIAVTRSPILAFNALCYFDFFQSKNISFLTQIVTLLISILAEENQFIPSSLLNVLVCILHAISNCFCEDSLTFLHSPLFSPYLLFVREIILLCHLLQLRYIKDGVSIPSPLLRRIASLLRLYYQLLVSLFYDNHTAWAASCLSDAAIACVKDFCCSADCSRTACTTDLCQLLIDLYRLKGLAPRAAVLDALCGCCRQADCRALLLKGIGVEALVDGLARTTDSVGTATAIVLILTSLLQDSALHVAPPLLSLHPALLPQACADLAFVESWSKYLLVRHARLNEPIRYDDIRVVERLFLHSNITSEMRFTRNLLALHLQTFSASSADEYITNPVLAQYTTKLSASLYILFSSTPANMMPAISSLSILIHNQRFQSSLHDKTVVKRLWDLLDAFAAKNKFSVVVELMNLLAMILHEGRRAGDASPIDPLLGASLLGKKTWERLCAISKKLCKQEKPFFTSILVAFTQALLFSAVHCIRSDDEKCWAVVSEHHLQSLLHLAAVDYSPAIMASLHNYAALFAIFDTIVVMEPSLLATWVEVLLLAAREQDDNLLITMLNLFTHVTSSYSVVAIMRDHHVMDRIVETLKRPQCDKAQLIIQSLYHVLAHTIEDPNLSSFLSPSHLVVLLHASFIDASIMSFTLHLFMLCLPRWNIDSINLHSQPLADAFSFVLSMFNTSSGQDRGVQHDIFFLVKQLANVGVLLPFDTHAASHHLLHQLFLSYLSSLRSLFYIELQANPKLSLPADFDASSEFVSNSARQSYAFSRRRSQQRRPLNPYVQYSVRSQPEVNSLLKDKSPHPICLEKEMGEKRECIVMWHEECHGAGNDIRKKDMEFHFEIPNYMCRCKACSRDANMDDVEVLIAFLGYLLCLATPSVDVRDSSAHLASIVSFEELMQLKKDVVKILRFGENSTIHLLNEKVEQLLQAMDRKPLIARVDRIPGKLRICDRKRNGSTEPQRTASEANHTPLEMLVKGILSALESTVLHSPSNSGPSVEVDRVVDCVT
ncbi:hypothetical protein WA556_001705 [Blastocystis sp. ATCC 50177/Nand II]